MFSYKFLFSCFQFISSHQLETGLAQWKLNHIEYDLRRAKKKRDLAALEEGFAKKLHFQSTHARELNRLHHALVRETLSVLLAPAREQDNETAQREQLLWLEKETNRVFNALWDQETENITEREMHTLRKSHKLISEIRALLGDK